MVTQHILFDLNFLSLLRLVVHPNMWSILDTWEKICPLLLLSEVFSIHLLGIVVLQCCSSLQFTFDLLHSCWTHYWKWNIETSNYYCSIVYFSLQLCQFLLHVDLGILSSDECLLVTSWWIDPFTFILFVSWNRK